MNPDPRPSALRFTAVLAVLASCVLPAPGAGLEVPGHPRVGPPAAMAAPMAVAPARMAVTPAPMAMAPALAAAMPVDTAIHPAPADTFLDAGARRLLRRVRERREGAEAEITHYTALVRESISMGLQALQRDRLVYRRQTAARVDWRRDGPSRIRVEGAREAVPIALKGVRVPEDLASDIGGLAFDPAQQQLLVGLNHDDFVRNPLAPGSGADYRFASGDTTTIQLPNGQAIRLIELRVLPRRADFQLVSGSFWVDSASDAVVEAVYRPARAFDLERDLSRVDSSDDNDTRDIPGLLKPIRIDVRYIAVEYGLWDMRWWLPRLISFHADATLGHLATFPLVYERTYSRYTVSSAAAAAVGPDTLTAVVPDTTAADSAVAGDTIGDPAAAGWGDLARTDWKPGRCEPREGLHCECDNGECHYYRVILPTDTAALLTSNLLPPSIFAQGEQLLTESDARQIANLVDGLPKAPWQPEPPTVAWGLGAPGLLRYNRVEGLSVGARADMGLGRARASLTARLGLADLQPEAELELARPAGGLHLAIYRRLDPVSRQVRPFSLTNSVQSLLFGIDDGDYYRAWGAELGGSSAGGGVSWRLFGERQGPARVRTELSVRHLTDAAYDFRPNIVADRATLAGADVRLRLDRGLNAAGVRWGGALQLEAAAGDYRYVRPELSAYLTLPASLLLGLEASGGSMLGNAPTQRLWYLGGAGSLQGYSGDAARGPAFWRGRIELANQLPAARLAVFGVAGWAGPKSDFGRGSPLIAAGVGGSFLDGLLRVDLARALRAPTGWRLVFYVDGLL